jgi:hypothetical protein
MGFAGQFISTLRVFERALGMPVPGFVIPFFIVLGGRTMGVSRTLVFLSRPSVKVVHDIPPWKNACSSLVSTGPANPRQGRHSACFASQREQEMAEQNSVVAIYATHVEAEEAVKELECGGIDMKILSIVAKETHTEEHAVGYYNNCDRMKYWGKAGAFWGGFWGLLFGSAFFIVPGIGPLLVAGPLVAWIVGALEGAVVVGGLSAIGAGLYGIGIPKDSIVNYELALKTDKYLLMAHGSATEVGKAREIIRGTHPISVELHAGQLVAAAK